ncbi:YbaB/EbfC family nucleoid-associated protein [Buchnera aphidicola (Kurisakia onigurumii)]|uniref:YbaB/EbfC family nucleoid-associated protein n=1 Tax=Buchnera aphidicola TaxID=9 RepID=UPI0031B70483
MFKSDNLTNLMQQAKNMQEKMQFMQKEIEKLEVIGESGAGLIKVTLFGNNQCKKIQIDPSLLIKKELDILEDLVVAAFNDALRKITEEKNKKMSTISSGINFPTNFNSSS